MMSLENPNISNPPEITFTNAEAVYQSGLKINANGLAKFSGLIVAPMIERQ
jgi:hypothetical protein